MWPPRLFGPCETTRISFSLSLSSLSLNMLLCNFIIFRILMSVINSNPGFSFTPQFVYEFKWTTRSQGRLHETSRTIYLVFGARSDLKFYKDRIDRYKKL